MTEVKDENSSYSIVIVGNESTRRAESCGHLSNISKFFVSCQFPRVNWDWAKGH